MILMAKENTGLISKNTDTNNHYESISKIELTQPIKEYKSLYRKVETNNKSSSNSSGYFEFIRVNLSLSDQVF